MSVLGFSPRPNPRTWRRRSIQTLFWAFILEPIPFGSSFSPSLHMEKEVLFPSPNIALKCAVAASSSSNGYWTTLGICHWDQRQFGHINPFPGSLGHTKQFYPGHGRKYCPPAKRYRQVTNQPLKLLAAYWSVTWLTNETNSPLCLFFLLSSRWDLRSRTAK